jgi:hypothetical protein
MVPSSIKHSEALHWYQIISLIKEKNEIYSVLNLIFSSKVNDQSMVVFALEKKSNIPFQPISRLLLLAKPAYPKERIKPFIVNLGTRQATDKIFRTIVFS